MRTNNESRRASPTLFRTGTKAGLAFAGSAIKGALLALVLGGVGFFYYLSQMKEPGLPAAGAGGLGAILALVCSPSSLVAILLGLYGVIYVALGIVEGRARSINQFVVAHGAAISQRLAGVIAGRIEAMPRVHGAIQTAPDWLTEAALSQPVAAALGESKVLRKVIGFVLNRLPLSDCWREWQEIRADANDVATPGTPDPTLRTLLGRRIDEVLHNFSTPSRAPLYFALAGHILLLGVGLWLVH